jgi:hypothetical protein
VDGSGVPWVASRDGGIYRFEGDGSWTRFDRSAGLPSNQVFDLETDAAGSVWACTAAGPARFDGATWHGGGLPDAITTPQCLDIAAAADGSLWAATLGGVLRRNGEMWVASTRADGLPSSVILTVQPALGGVWATTPAGFGYWDDSSWRAFDDATVRPVDGIRTYNLSPFASEYAEGIFFAPGVSDILAEGARTRFQRLDPDGSTQTYMNEGAYKATSVAPDATVYVGMELGGFYVIRGAAQKVDDLAGVRVFRVGELWAQPDGTVWMDSQPGLFEIRADGEVRHHVEVDGLEYALTGTGLVGDFSDGTLVSMGFGPDGSVWAVSNDMGGRLDDE